MIQLIVLCASFLLASSAQAITKRTSKECLICHVLWFDVFKTDQKTLIKQTDSAIVIAGAMGLASSKAMCLSCHDGYVFDSRVMIVKGNPHHSRKKLPDGLKLPEGFRLDSNNEIYCGTCHTFHDIKGSGEVGGIPFMRKDNESSQMCIACHGTKAGQQKFTDHRFQEGADNFPRLEAAKKGSKFGPAQEIICESCHSAHGEGALVSLFQNYGRFHRVHQWGPKSPNNDDGKNSEVRP